MATPPEPHEPHAKKHPPTRAEFEARAQEARADFEARAQEARAQFDATQEKIRARTGRNLLAAIGIGVGLGAIFLASLIIPNLKWLFIIFGAGLIGFTAFELSSALRQAGRDIPRVASTVGKLLQSAIEEGDHGACDGY